MWTDGGNIDGSLGATGHFKTVHVAQMGFEGNVDVFQVQFGNGTEIVSVTFEIVAGHELLLKVEPLCSVTSWSLGTGGFFLGL